MLEKTNRINLLFDFYAPLLKERQVQFLEMYYREDLSLSEIAEITDVSRQAVFDQLKRTEAVLEQYEEGLHLLARYQERKRRLSELLAAVEQTDEYNQDRIKALVKELARFELEQG
ncbi:putative DNA-binding protein [Ammoniphilus resinae]|uniref:UPF0122 protein J2Z37_000745 n=1 Tax=Ammoniphilus resinae TaxID=861532 RepID=A0ABS4GKG0_9BACL|nr:putative DNA-binding protein [Ammoniphilus resinae]MBP1930758.1 putative DNA-binding protein YlxM (UPF0122 family) [Ammoniphilus resinae]